MEDVGRRGGRIYGGHWLSGSPRSYSVRFHSGDSAGPGRCASVAAPGAFCPSHLGIASLWSGQPVSLREGSQPTRTGPSAPLCRGVGGLSPTRISVSASFEIRCVSLQPMPCSSE